MSEIYPGSIDTAMTTETAYCNKLSKRQQRIITPAKTVAYWAISGFEHGKTAIHPHQWYILPYLLTARFFPKILPHILGTSFVKMLHR